jgi:uncharacterized protein YjbJ (UPF0337 family)
LVLIFPPLYHSKGSGQYHSLKGTVVETVGDMTGAKSWTDSGKQEHASGEAEYKAAQAKGYAEGLKDNISGKKDTVVGALTGDRQQEATGAFSLPICNFNHRRGRPSGNVQQDKGRAQQALNRPT